MIPRTIHYCWFGNNPIPPVQQRYIEEWKRLMPDYTFKCWTEKEFAVDSIPFASQAYHAGKLAFVADYVRIHALFHEGGIYMDTDVRLFKRLDEYLSCGVFTSYEYNTPRKDLRLLSELLTEEGDRRDKSVLKVPGNGLLSALIGAEKGHPFIKDCYDFYNRADFAEVFEKRLTIPVVLALQAEKYGFKYLNQRQDLKENIRIFDTSVFSNYHNASSRSVAIHECAGSWVNEKFLTRIKSRLHRIAWMRSSINACYALIGRKK